MSQKKFIKKYLEETCKNNPNMSRKTIYDILCKVYQCSSQQGGSYSSQNTNIYQFTILARKVKDQVCGSYMILTGDVVDELYKLYEPFYNADSPDDMINLIPLGELKTFAIAEKNKGHNPLEYLLAELFELASGCDEANERNYMTVKCIRNAVNADKELYKMFESCGTLSDKYHRNY